MDTYFTNEETHENMDMKNKKKPNHKHDKKPCSHQRCGGKHYANHCVEDVLKAILQAQRKIKDNGCETSCANSIDSLLGKEKRPVNKNTIPVILYCGCHPFKGTGAVTYSCKSSHKKRFKCVESFVFKVKNIDHNCAVLELLVFKSDIMPSSKGNKHICCPCCQIDHKPVHDLIGTGICINVDLSCFCAVTCLDPVLIK